MQCAIPGVTMLHKQLSCGQVMVYVLKEKSSLI